MEEFGGGNLFARFPDFLPLLKFYFATSCLNLNFMLLFSFNFGNI
jgi:hypothetical protein